METKTIHEMILDMSEQNKDSLSTLKSLIQADVIRWVRVDDVVNRLKEMKSKEVIKQSMGGTVLADVLIDELIKVKNVYKEV